MGPLIECQEQELENSVLEDKMSPYIGSVLRLPTRLVVRNLCAAAAQKATLPSLPVPLLSDTLKKYVKSVKPFLDNNELERTEEIVKEFGSGIGQKLQCLLEKRAKKSKNWLEDWWLKVAYLEFRSPVVFYSSPGLVFPVQKFKCKEDQLQYAAQMVRAAVDYKVLIDSNLIPQEKMGKALLDMSQYSKVFGTCRIPEIPGDDLEYNKSNHIIVMHNNHFFTMDVFTREGTPLTSGQIFNNLKDIVCASKERASYPVGILSSDHRDNWTQAYKLLIKNPVNKESLCTIANSLFTLSIDRCCYDPSELVTCKKDHMTIAGHLTVTGGGSLFNSGNRWFDKTIQFVVDDKGHNGLTYEHSPAEGQPIAVMTDHIVKYINDKSNACDNSEDSTDDIIRPEKLKFEFSSEVKQAVSEAERNIDKLVEDIDMKCFKFTEFGKEYIKKQKLSPDSFIQMAIQLAFYRLHDEPGAHYESAATRMFHHGRTETIRSCSVESIAFCKAMLSSCACDNEKVVALRTAITAHKDYTLQALQGLGVDRHLLGLKLIAAEYNLPLPDLFKDKAYKRSINMRISTSQVASKCDGFMVYGPIVHDGYACCYNPRPDDINFGTSCFKSCPATSAEKWKNAIIESLVDMKCVLDKSPQAKL